jgi:membrane protein insertase Oxa1/YidC/SpoIIIJ
LYEPLFNLLVWIYNNWTDQSLGWAVVYLTILLRVVLLPFTIISERNKMRNQELEREIVRIDKEFQNDPILKKEEIRRALKHRRVQPWAKSVTLGIQALVFVLLYQVFLRGVTGEKILQILYPWVDFPGTINTMFYGFDLAASYDVLAAGIVGLWLAVDIYFSARRNKTKAIRADLFYFIMFPFAVFLFLYLLPMVKALFILTSIFFSAIVHGFVKILTSGKPEEKETSS